MSLSDVTSILGEWMLKGWVLTDRSCSTCSTPLMRSPRAFAKEVWFCAKCDGGPPGQENKSSHPVVPNTTADSSASSATSHSTISTPSTPATEISTLTDMSFAPPPETEESRRRRAQSDRASEELGRRLLRGWAMLGEECPSSGCYGVPLMRPPNKGDERSPNKECVICGTIYTTDASGHLVSTTETLNAPLPSSLSGHTVEQSPKAWSTARSPEPPRPVQPTTRGLSHGVESDAPLPHLLSETSANLQFALSSLSTNLTTLAPSSSQNPEAISRVAHAISEVALALRHVEQLRKDQAQ